MGIVRNQSIKNSVSFYIGMLFGAVNTVIIYPNVFKENPEHFGLIQILIAYAIVISTFTTLGIPKTFVKHFPTIKEKGQLYFLSIIIPLIGFVFASLSYFLFKEQIFEVLNASKLLRDNFFYIILLVFFIGFYDVLTSISRSFLSAATPVFINEVFLKLYSMSMLLLHWFGYLEFSDFLKIYLFGYVLKFGILYFLQWKNNRLELSVSMTDLKIKELLRFGVYVMVGGASIMIVTRVDMMMIGTLLDLQQVAFYTVAFFIGNVIKVPAKSIGAIATPLVAKAWENNNIKELRLIYTKSSINQLIVGGIFFLCIWINIDAIFSLLPEKFSHGKWVVFFIGLSQLFNIATGVNSAIIINSKHFRYDLFTNILLLFFTIISNYILIPKYGINGAAIATALSVFLFNIIRLIIIKSKMGMQPFTYKTGYSVLVFLIIYAISNYFPLSGILYVDIVWKSFLVILIFIPPLFLFALSEDIMKLVFDIRRRFGF